MRSANADRASTWSMPAARAAAIVSAWTCETKPSVGTARSSGSSFMAATVSMGRSLAASRSKTTSRGFLSLIASSVRSPVRSK
jgi:hypothetical protein